MKKLLVVGLVFWLVMSGFSQQSQQLYNDVQNLYGAATTSDCERAKTLYAQLEQYKTYRDPVPAEKAYSVNFPNGQVTNPTIADLVADRQARIKSQFRDCFANVSDASTRLYNQVQGIYMQYSSLASTDCAGIRSLVDQLEPYKGYPDPVPASYAYTVNFPNGTVPNPRIADLAYDRQSRIMSQFKSCFTPVGPSLDATLMNSLVGSWDYQFNGRDHTLQVIVKDGNISAAYTRHGYSYPPVYQGYEPMSNTGVKFRFQLGGTYIVEFQLFQQQDGGKAGWVYESWTGTNTNIVILNSTRGFAPAQPPPPSVSSNRLMAGGFEGRYFNSTNPYEGEPALVRMDEVLDFDWGSGSPSPAVLDDNFSVRWEGEITVPVAGEYTFYIVADDGVRLEVNTNRYIDEWKDQAPTEYKATMYMGATPTNFRIIYYERGGGAVLRAYISGPNMPKQVIR